MSKKRTNLQVSADPPIFKTSHIYKKNEDILTETRQRVINGDPNEPIKIVRSINNELMEIIVSSKGTEITTDMSNSQITEFLHKWHQLWKPALPKEEGCTSKRKDILKQELFVANFEPFPRQKDD